MGTERPAWVEELVKPCRVCGRRVVFLKDQDGKTQVLDVVAPVYIVTEGGPGPCARSRAAYVSHWATCPKADEVRKS